MKTHLRLGLALAVLGFVCACKPEVRTPDLPQVVTHMSAAEATELALPHILAAYPGADRDAGDYDTSYADGVWTVYPKLHGKLMLGGGPTADIDDRQRRVLRTYFTE